MELAHYLIMFFSARVLLRAELHPTIYTKTTTVEVGEKAVTDSQSGRLLLAVYLKPITNQFSCDDNRRDALLLVAADCWSSALMQHFLDQCQSRSVEKCQERTDDTAWVEQSADFVDCIRNFGHTFSVTYYCIPIYNQYEVCSLGRKATYSQPSVILHTGRLSYLENKPCICYVEDGREATVSLHRFTRENGTNSQFKANGVSYRSHTEFHAADEYLSRKYNGVTFWLSGQDPPLVFLVGLYGSKPLTISCGSKFVRLHGGPPQVLYPQPTKATVSCKFPVNNNEWQLDKFGMAFSKSNHTSEEAVNRVDNSIYCQRGNESGSFVSNVSAEQESSGQFSYKTAYQVDNKAEISDMCAMSSFKGNLTFTVTVTISAKTKFDPQAQWYCLYELFDMIRVSEFVPAPPQEEAASSAMTDTTSTSTAGPTTVTTTAAHEQNPTNYSQTTESFTGNSSTREPDTEEVSGEDKRTPLWVFAVALPAGAVVLMAGMLFLYRLMNGRRSTPGIQGDRSNHSTHSTLASRGGSGPVYGAHTSSHKKVASEYGKLATTALLGQLVQSVSSPATMPVITAKPSQIYSENSPPSVYSESPRKRVKKTYKTRKRYNSE